MEYLEKQTFIRKSCQICTPGSFRLYNCENVFLLKIPANLWVNLMSY